MSPASPHSYAVFCVYALRAEKNAIFIFFFTVIYSNSHFWRAKRTEESNLVSFCSVFFHVFPPVLFLSLETKWTSKPNKTGILHGPPPQIHKPLWKTPC